MIPFYMGTRDRQLFGVYHPSKHYPSYSHGILLCPAVGQEYMRSHMAFRQMAVQLSSIGFDVLKFDYYGVGDSAGNCEEGNVEIWKDDIYRAYQELKDMSGVQSISIVGLRLGAALAAKTVSDGLIVKNILMWDPIINGVKYIQELRELTSKMLDGKFENWPDGTEILGGFPFSKENISFISDIDLMKLHPNPQKNILLFFSEHNEDYLQLLNHIDKLRIPFKVEGMLNFHSPNSSDLTNSRQEQEGQLINNLWMNWSEFDQAVIVPNAIAKIISMLKNAV